MINWLFVKYSYFDYFNILLIKIPVLSLRCQKPWLVKYFFCTEVPCIKCRFSSGCVTLYFCISAFLCFQRRTKQKVVTDFATLSKGTSAGAKPRTALKQVLFSQGVSDKASEVLCCAHQTTCWFSKEQIQTCCKGNRPHKRPNLQQQCSSFCSTVILLDVTCGQN